MRHVANSRAFCSQSFIHPSIVVVINHLTGAPVIDARPIVIERRARVIAFANERTNERTIDRSIAIDRCFDRARRARARAGDERLKALALGN